MFVKCRKNLYGFDLIFFCFLSLSKEDGFLAGNHMGIELSEVLLNAFLA